jgi:hypothetical protein
MKGEWRTTPASMEMSPWCRRLVAFSDRDGGARWGRWYVLRVVRLRRSRDWLRAGRVARRDPGGEASRGRLAVDEHYRTAIPGIYAVCDRIGFPALASTSMEQGRLATCHAFGVKAHSVSERFPYGIYAVPEISMVGKNEEELTEAAIPYEIGKARYKEIACGQILGDVTGLLKLIFHGETRRLLGVHIIGEGASELIHIGQAMLSFDGKIDYFIETVFNYPTLAECYKVAAFDGINRLGIFEPEPATIP